MAQELLVRMFFANRLIETRPLTWVKFTTPEEMLEESGKDLAKKLEGEVKDDGEVYLCFVNELTGLQIYRDEYIDARKRTRDKPGASKHTERRDGHSRNPSARGRQ